MAQMSKSPVGVTGSANASGPSSSGSGFLGSFGSTLAEIGGGLITVAAGPEVGQTAAAATSPTAETGAAKVVGTVNSATSPLSALIDFLEKLLEPSTWIRLLEALGGVILIILGLRQLASVASGSQQVKGIPTPSVVPV